MLPFSPVLPYGAMLSPPTLINERRALKMASDGRLARGVAANLFATIMRIVTQLAVLPVMFAFMTPAEVGFWSMAWVIPGYLLIAAQGFAAAGANRCLQEETENAARSAAIFRSVARRAVLTTVGAWLLAWAAVEFVMVDQAARAVPIGAGEVRGMVLLLGLGALASALMAAFEVPLRAAGRYPTHIALGALAAGAELIFLAAALVAGGSFLALSAAVAVSRVLVCAVAWRAARAASTMLVAETGVGGGGDLWRPALGFMLLPLVFAINLHAYVLLIGATFGTAFLAAFLATRTLTRVFDLFTNFLFSASYHEIAHHRTRDGPILSRAAASATLTVLLAGLAFGACLVAAGQPVQRVWTLGETAFDPVIAGIVLAAAICRGFAAFPSAILAATNDHVPSSVAYLIASAVGFAAACVVASLNGPAWLVLCPLVAVEAAYAAIVLCQCLRRDRWSNRMFLRQVFSRESIRQLVQLVLSLAGRRRAHV